nr:MerR family transcriptional regulator [Cryptosporangium arvum]
MTGPGLRSGEVAAAAGVNPQTLRYYERRGLLAEPRRSPGGHRLYPAGTVTLLRVVKAAQRLGFTLDEVADLLEAGRHRHRADAGLQARARTKLAEIDARLADLHTIRDTLADAVDAGCDDLITCADSPRCPLPFSDLAEVSGAAERTAEPRADTCGTPERTAQTRPDTCGTPARTAQTRPDTCGTPARTAQTRPDTCGTPARTAPPRVDACCAPVERSAPE